MESIPQAELDRDPRLRSGEAVHARASLVAPKHICNQVFGASWSTVFVTGTVLSSGKKAVKKRKVRVVTADYQVGNRSYKKELQLSQISAGAAPDRTVPQSRRRTQ